MRSNRLFLFAISLLLLPWGGALAEASLFIYPTAVIFEGNQRSAEVTLANRGDQVGTFEVGWVDMSMTEAGGLMRHEEQTSWSVQPFVRYSPRRVTLAPSESQVIKIALRRDDTVGEGEYYSHMRVLTLNSAPLESLEDGAPEPAPGVTVEARTAIAIPVIWRNSRAGSAATIEALRVDRDANVVNIDVRREGLLSARGYVHLLNFGIGGEPQPFAEPVPLIMYPNVDHRSVSVALLDGVTLADLPERAAVYFSPDQVLNDRSIVYASQSLKSGQ